MKPTNCKEISDALIEAMNRENLHTREAARALNLNPCYVSMVQNPKSWDQIGKTAWARIEDWFYTRGPIVLFEIPAMEQIWKPKEKVYTPDPNQDKRQKEKDKIEEKIGQEVLSNDEKTLSKDRKTNVKKLLKQSKNTNILPSHPFEAKQPITEQQFTDTARLKIALDIEINLLINGQKVEIV
jgi:hypothetical protein